MGKVKHELYKQPLRKNDEGKAPATAPGCGEQTAGRLPLPKLLLLERRSLCQCLLPGCHTLAGKGGGNFGPR